MARAPRSDLLTFLGALFGASLGLLFPLVLGVVVHFGGPSAGVSGGLLYVIAAWGFALLLSFVARPATVAAALLIALAACVHLRHGDLLAVWPASLVPAGEGYGAAVPGLGLLVVVHVGMGWLGLFSAHQYRARAADAADLTRAYARSTAAVLVAQVSAVIAFFAIEALPLGTQGSQSALVGAVVIGAAVLAVRANGALIGRLVPAFLLAFLAHLALWVPDAPAGATLAARVGVDAVIIVVVGTLVFTALVLVRVFLGIRPPAHTEAPQRGP